MIDSQIAAQLVRMKEDWNRRAAENACWYINTLRLDQTEEEFDRSGVEGVAQWILPELELLTQHADPKTLRFLEIGCGIGRMTRPLAAIFGEVAATDVAGEMIARARERLADLENVHFTETSGADVGPLPADYFDIVYSIFVFQHVPTKEAIRATLVDAWRVLRPGGLLRFQTNGVTTESFRAMEKNTWVGETFTEAEVRELARELGARVVSIYGADTMYCFSTLRKPESDEISSPIRPRILSHGRADDPAIQEIPAAGNDAWLALVVEGVDQRQADTNTIRVEIGGVPVVPRYAGQLRPHFRHRLPAECATLLYLEAPIPADLLPGPAVVRVIWTPEVVSPPDMVKIVEPLPAMTTMISFRNVVDYGTDLEVEGPKSVVTIFVVGLDRSATIDNVRLRLTRREPAPDFPAPDFPAVELVPTYVGYDASVASDKVDLQLPEDPAALDPGHYICHLLFKGVASVPLEIELKKRSAR